MTSVDDPSQGKMAVAQSLSGRLLKIYVKRIIRTPKFMRWVLDAWEPSGDESAEFLQVLTEEMTLEWWRKQRSAVKKQIVGGLIRIDGGRGIIADWLALIVRMENDVSVLESAACWESGKYRFGSQLLDAWYQKSLNDLSNTHAIRKTALKVMVKTILPSDISQEEGRERVWNEEQRAKMILGYLAEQHLSVDLGKVVDMLEIMASWEPPPELHGERVLYEIFCEWEKRMQDIADIIAETVRSGQNYYKIWGICTPKFSERMSDRQFLEQRCLRATWEGLIRLSSYCTDISDRLLSWMEHWLQYGNMVAWEVESEMSKWNPPDECQRERVAVLWGRYLLSPCGGYKNPDVWTAVGRYVAECQKPGSGMKEICDNCLEALGLVVTMPEEWKAGVMKAIVCPPWLTEEQQAEWNRLWVELMQSSSENAVRMAARHLLGLVTKGLANQDSVKKDILKRLKNLNTGTGVEIIQGLLDEIGQWEGNGNSSGEMFYEVWAQLRQSPWWDEPEIRKIAVKTLAWCLGKKLERGREAPQLVSLWVESLSGERNSEVFFSLQAGQRGMMKIHPGFCPASVEMWRQLLRNRNPKIRRIAWEFFLSLEDGMGNETGVWLTERLQQENTLNVLQVMAQWRAPSGKPLPAGFGGKWANCLQALAAQAAQSFVSGRSWQFDLEERLGNVVSVAKSVVKNCAIAWLQEQPGGDGQSAKLAELRIFWETMAETMNSFSGEKIVGEVKRIQKSMDALFQMDESPEKFWDSFAVMNASEGEQARKDDFWEDLIEHLRDRDVRMFPANVRHNLGVVAASLLGQKRHVAEELQQFFVELCGDGTWTPDRRPAGWDEFCHEFCRACKEIICGKPTSAMDSIMEKVCVMSRIGHTSSDERCHELFRQTLCQILRLANQELAPLIESALWRETMAGCEMAERSAPDGKGWDEAGRRRWLREFLRSCDPETAVGDEAGEGIKGFVNSLWMELKTDLFPQKATGNRERGGGGCLSSGQRGDCFCSSTPGRKPLVRNHRRVD